MMTIAMMMHRLATAELDDTMVAPLKASSDRLQLRTKPNGFSRPAALHSGPEDLAEGSNRLLPIAQCGG